jgi:hypothetical protein
VENESLDFVGMVAPPLKNAAVEPVHTVTFIAGSSSPNKEIHFAMQTFFGSATALAIRHNSPLLCDADVLRLGEEACLRHLLR